MSVARVHISTFFDSDDIGNVIDEAKRKAASANDTASNTLDKLNTIRKEIDNINVTPVDSNLGNVLDDVDKSGEIYKLFKNFIVQNKQFHYNVSTLFSTCSEEPVEHHPSAEW